jgi:hypothetical protein
VEEQVSYKVDMVPPGEFLGSRRRTGRDSLEKSGPFSEVVIRPDGMISMPLIGDVPQQI